MEFLNKFKIPTILGLGIILLGLGSGLYLVLKEQVFLSRAAPDLTPQNITVTNITEDTAVISWQTNSQTASFIIFGQKGSGEQTVLDDRDKDRPTPRFVHYVTLKNLLPQTHYQFKIVSGKLTSPATSFDTAKPISSQTGFGPVIGSVSDDGKPVNEGIAYLSLDTAVIQSAEVKAGGNFLIPLSSIRKADLSDILALADAMPAKITIISNKGSATINFFLTASSVLPLVSLGQNVDLTVKENRADKYDLNGDGKINSADYTVISSCFGKKPEVMVSNMSCAKADLNSDSKIDQKDLNLMSQKLKE